MTYGERANRPSMGEDCVLEALMCRGFDLTKGYIKKAYLNEEAIEEFNRHLTDFIANMIDSEILKDLWEEKNG